MRWVSRRRYVQGMATLATGAIAGCSGSGGDGGAVGTVDAPEDVTDYLSETSNFEGYMEDETDADRTTVAVGAEGNGGDLAFEPPALQVTTKTTVVWDWTGNGTEHNVVEQSDYFSSGDPVSGADKRFELGFQESGTYLYYCRPHESVGMKGALVVVE